jgi:hypothetical protein
VKNDEKNVDKTYPPAKDHLFQPGNPGGPGRPKGSIGLKRLLKEVAKSDNGERLRVAARSAIDRANWDTRTLCFLMAYLGDDFD